MSIFADRLKLLRAEKEYSQRELADALKISKSSVNMYERGEREPNFETIEAIADFFNVDMNYLYGKSNARRGATTGKAQPVPIGFEPLPETARLPRVGQIACGQPITAEENLEGYDDVPSRWHGDFTLVCKGDSMLPRIQDNDIVVIKKQSSVENGEIAAIRIDNEATLKHVYIYKNKVVLQPENPDYEPIVLIGEEINSLSIEGKAVGLCRGLQ